MEKLKNFKLTPYRIALLLSIFSFILPSLFSPLSGESLEVLGYLHKESLHNYYTAAIIIFIILIFIKPIKKYPFLFLFLPILIVIVFYLRMLGIIFSSDYQIFEYDSKQYLAEIGVSSPSRAQFINFYEFDGQHKSKNIIMDGWTKNGFDSDTPFKLNSFTCYMNGEKSNQIVDCSYYGINPEDIEENYE